MVIETENLSLVLQTTEEVLAWVDTLDVATRAEISPDWLARIKASPLADPWTHGFAMVHRASGVAIGSCLYKAPPSPEGMVEIAYGVDPQYQGQGYATEAARALVVFAFRSGLVRVVRAHTRLEGETSMRVLGKCGFERIGQFMDPEDGLVWRWEMSQEAA